jgi:hypothetical protein
LVELFLEVWLEILENPSIEGLMVVPIDIKEDCKTSLRDYLLTREFSASGKK